MNTATAQTTTRGLNILGHIEYQRYASHPAAIIHDDGVIEMTDMVRRVSKRLTEMHNRPIDYRSAEARQIKWNYRHAGYLYDAIQNNEVDKGISTPALFKLINQANAERYD